MNKEKEICDMCSQKDGAKKCKNEKRKNERGISVCENFSFLLPTDIPYEVIYNLLENENFYNDLSELVGLIFTILMKRRLFKVKIDIENKELCIKRINQYSHFEYDKFNFNSITIGDEFCVMDFNEIDKNILETIFQNEDSIFLLDIKDYKLKDGEFFLIKYCTYTYPMKSRIKALFTKTYEKPQLTLLFEKTHSYDKLEE